MREEIFLKEEVNNKILADKIIGMIKKQTGPIVLALTGDLGSGKTTFVKYFGKLLGIKEKILSPTFMIFRTYFLDKKSDFEKIYHVDLYRIKEVSELEVLSFSEILNNKKNIILVEWADKFKEIIPEGAIWIDFKSGAQPNERIVAISN